MVSQQTNKPRRFRVVLIYMVEERTEEKIRGLRVQLEECGADVFVFNNDMPLVESHETEMDRRITLADAVIICYSKNFEKGRGYRHQEVDRALTEQKKRPRGNAYLITVRVDECEIPGYLSAARVVNYFHRDHIDGIMHWGLVVRREQLLEEGENIQKFNFPLSQTESETDTPLLAAHRSQESHIQGRSALPVGREEGLHLVDTYIHEHGNIPVVDITLYNRGTQTAFPTGVQLEILDVGEFCYCNEEDENVDPMRALLAVSGTYDIILSPIFKGKRLLTKIAHQLRSDEADRFQLRINQDQAGWSFAYTWYYLKIVISYDNPAHLLESPPILLSLPPVDKNATDMWKLSDTLCCEQNRATLRRMSELEAIRSASVDDTIRQILGK